MLRLPSELYHRFRNILLECDEFESNASLRALFVIDELYPFFNRLPEATSKHERVDKCLEFLLSLQLANNRPVLPVFISVLRGRYAQEDERYTKLEAARIEIENICLSQSRTASQPRYDLAQPGNFDLTGLIRCCVNELVKQKHGLIGFGLPYENLKFLEYLCNRLKDQWGREKFSYTYSSLKIDPVPLPAPKAVKKIMGYKSNVNDGDVLFGIVASQESMRTFWHELYDKIGSEALPHRLIVILATDVGCNFPQHIIPLPLPQFDFSDIHEWVKEVVKSFHLSDVVVDTWRDWMIHECCEDEIFEIQSVYMHIEYMLNKLRRNPTVHCFQEELKERNVNYVQTPY